MVSLHADHVVKDEEAFRHAVCASVGAARQGHLVTIGIVPTYPETGFGYIEREGLLDTWEGAPIYRVSRFTEKPALAAAVEFLATGRYSWNSGYFTWTLAQFLSEFDRQLPDSGARVRAIARGSDTLSAADAAALWEGIRPVSIDVGIMEHAADVAVVPAEMGWSDVGSWAAIYDVLDKDDDGNVRSGSAEHLAIGSRNTLVHSSGGRVIATVGVEDLIVVDTGDAILVLRRDKAQDVGRLVARLREQGRDELL
jgi:mannose-1-phosphate guanylyltransferase